MAGLLGAKTYSTSNPWGSLGSGNWQIQPNIAVGGGDSGEGSGSPTGYEQYINGGFQGDPNLHVLDMYGNQLVNMNGQNYYRIGDAPLSTQNRTYDPNQVINDPRYGNLITQAYGDQQFRPTPQSGLGNFMMNSFPYVVGALMTGGAMGAFDGAGAGVEGAGAGGGFGGGAGGAAAEGATGLDIPSWLANAPSDLGAVAAPGAGGATVGSGILDGAGGIVSNGLGINGATPGGLWNSITAGLPSSLSDVPGWVAQNPYRAYQLLSGGIGLGSSLLGNHGGSSGSGGGGNNGGGLLGGGSISGFNPKPQQFQMNPYNAMQLSQLYGGRYG